jgi:hypothetical protein
MALPVYQEGGLTENEKKLRGVPLHVFLPLFSSKDTKL